MSHVTTLKSTAITAPQYPPAGTNTVNRALTPKRPRPVVENDAYAAFAQRIMTAYARRIAGGDIDSLFLLTALAGDIGTAIGQAGYPGFSGGGKGMPEGPSKASPCRPRGFWGRALPARARR